jgi:hypothetical protein
LNVTSQRALTTQTVQAALAPTTVRAMIQPAVPVPGAGGASSTNAVARAVCSVRSTATAFLTVGMSAPA